MGASFVECCGAAPVGCEMGESFVEATVRRRRAVGATEGTGGTEGATASRGATPAGIGTGMETEGAIASKGATPAGVGTGTEPRTDGTGGTEVPHLADPLARPRAVFLSAFVQPSSSSTGRLVVKWTERLRVETSGAPAPAFSRVDGWGTSAMAAALAPEFCACGTTTCRARGEGCRGEYATGIARVAHALAITHAAGANTRRGNMASRPAHVR